MMFVNCKVVGYFVPKVFKAVISAGSEGQLSPKKSRDFLGCGGLFNSFCTKCWRHIRNLSKALDDSASIKQKNWVGIGF